jgi:hypothetical protein
MTYTTALLFSSSILVPAGIALFRYKKIVRDFHPFLWAIWLGTANEILGYFLTHAGYSNAVNNNTYVLAESLLFTWQFRNWGLFRPFPRLFPVLVALLMLGWSAEMLLPGKMLLTVSYFRIGYSFMLVLMSIQMLNKQLLEERGVLLKNPIFLITLGFIIFYLYKVLTGMFTIYGLSESKAFRLKLLTIMISINLFANLIYGIAILCIPRKIRFSMPF